MYVVEGEKDGGVRAGDADEFNLVLLKKRGTNHKSLRKYDVSISVMYYRDLLQLKWCLKVWKDISRKWLFIS